MRPDNGLMHLYFSTEGRINRQTFWLQGFLLFWLIWIGIGIIFGSMIGLALGIGVIGDDFGVLAGAAALMLAVLVIAQIFVLPWTMLAVIVKRLHDRDKSGWFVLIWLALMTVGVFLFGLGPIIAFVWMFIELGCLEGTLGPNRYGEDPSPRPWLRRGPYAPYPGDWPYQDYVNCPFCAEPVRWGAVMCRHCRADLRAAFPAPPYPPPALAQPAPAQSPMSFPQLTLPTGQVFTITGAVRIGRSDEVEITVADPNVSRIHAVVTGEPGSLTIEDNASANGTYVNGVRVQTAALNAGDRIQVGSTEIAVSF